MVKVTDAAQEPSRKSEEPTSKVHGKRKRDIQSRPYVIEGQSIGDLKDSESHKSFETNSNIIGIISKFLIYCVYFCSLFFVF